ncbi:type III PLP-dependent enzyme [Saccharomonospora marina]|uniref:type III PLP-dependent enzyme n=1 Tax=Saccharomonospora marina TaxID=632569 RepID=UPI0005934FC2|nr:type III PLP-dependent enzyme [Saccharomonospora marina]
MSPTVGRIRAFLAEHDPPTPCLVIDIDTVLDSYRCLADAFPGARIQYAVKANPAAAVLRALVGEGASFDVASPAEIRLCLAAGARPRSISYGNPIKKPADIAFAHSAGVDEFCFDSLADLENIAEHAPGARVLARLAVDGPESATPFGHKFGCDAESAAELLSRAAHLGLRATGLSFHVGSQQLDPGAWELAIGTAAKVFEAAAADGTVLNRLNIGGGFGVDYRAAAPSPHEYAASVLPALRSHFERPPELLLEPGRAVVGAAGLIRSEVVLVANRRGESERRWVYLDIGRYNGLAETENEAIAYRLEVVGDHPEPDGPVIIAGPTCDGDDVLYQRTPYRLPLSLRPGDRIDILATGAYTASYSSIAFNGIEPLRTYCVSEGRLISAE